MAVTTRSRGTTPRKPVAEEQTSQIPLRSPTTTIRTTSSKPSPYYLLIYAAILAAGSLYSQISPAGSSRAAPLAPGITSDLNTPTDLPIPSYFASKQNLVNIYFVKFGWFWTTLAFTLLQATTRPSSRPISRPTQTHYIQSITRYTLVTLSWIFTTQWLFGPALIDRSFTITGGYCEARPATLRDSPELANLSALSSSMACKVAGGRWRGGHDISGHVFMLVLSSAFLLLELHLSDAHSAHPHVSDRAAAGIARDMTPEERKAVGGWESEGMAKFRMYSRYFVWGVVALDLWMLMMTAIWFHTWMEKLSGLLIATSTLFGVYWMADFVPAWRALVGGL
jgi:hypothetical protein